jgi:hypothetical protein
MPVDFHSYNSQTAIQCLHFPDPPLCEVICRTPLWLVSVLACSTDNTVLLKGEVVHCLVNGLLYLFPIGTSLNEFINILYNPAQNESNETSVLLDTDLRAISSAISCDVPDNLSQVFCILDNKHVP